MNKDEFIEALVKQIKGRDDVINDLNKIIDRYKVIVDGLYDVLLSK